MRDYVAILRNSWQADCGFLNNCAATTGRITQFLTGGEAVLFEIFVIWIYDMKRRAEWIAKMIWGWLCYQLLTKTPMSCLTRFGSWVLSWAGFYAHDTGYRNWLINVENKDR